MRSGSSTTNAHSEMGQMAVCCQKPTLGELSSHSALSVLVGALFKKVGLFFNKPCSFMWTYQRLFMYFSYKVLVYLQLQRKRASGQNRRLNKTAVRILTDFFVDVLSYHLV
jgi:hypothetical protein